MFIDTHAHLMVSEFDQDRDEVILRALDAGVEKILSLGCSVSTSEESLSFSRIFAAVYGSVGIHPYDAAVVDDALMANYEKLLLHNSKLVAVGETGLDYHRPGSDIAGQRAALIKHFELARACDLPIVVHSREAQDDVIEILDQFKGVRGVIHCFSYDLEQAKEVWKRGFYTSFTGIVTYHNAAYLQEVIKHAPRDMVMIETDSPYLAPQKYRGERNEPAYVVEVAKKIAEIWACDLEEVAQLTSNNAMTLFERLQNAD